MGYVDALLGRMVAGKYLLLSELGSGAMGTVYRARQIALDKIVALKILRRDLEQTSEFIDRFEVEAKAASKLDHPNSTRVLDFGREPDGVLYIAMEFVEGRALADVLNEWPLADARIASILIQALSVMGVAHDQGILHRDLKPENILLVVGQDDEGRKTEVVKVCDFGIAKVTGTRRLSSFPAAIVPQGDPKAGSRLTRMGIVLGTPAYMSPEQAAGDPLDARSDLYALGVILYELLTGRLPFEHELPEMLAQLHISAPVPPPEQVRPGANAGLARICMRALEKEPAKRYANARDMRADLREVHDLALAAPVPPESATRIRAASSEHATLRAERPAARKRGWLAVPLALALVLVGGVFALARRAQPGPTPPRAPVAAAAPPADVPTPTVALPTAPPESLATAPPESLATAPPESLATAPPGSNDALGVRSPAPGRRPPTSSSHGAKSPPMSATAAPPADPRPAVAGAPSPPSAVAPAPEPSAVTPASSPVPPPAPPPAATAVPTPPPAPPASPRPFDPSRAHVAVGQISTVGVTTRDVTNALARADLRGCYLAAVRAGASSSTASFMISLKIEDLRVLRVSVAPEGASPVLRRCIADRLVGARMPSADTGSGSAEVAVTMGAE